LAANGVVQALYHRERTGEGQMVDASILNASMFNNSRVYSTPDGKHFDRPVTDGEQLGFGPRYRLYECADGWLCLAVVSDAERAALHAVVPKSSEVTEDAELTSVLEAWCRQRKVQDAFYELDAGGVPCEISDPDFCLSLFDDPEMIERRWVTTYEHPLLGKVNMFGAGIDFSGTPSQLHTKAVVFGRETVEVLGEYGYSPAEIEQMLVSGAVSGPREPAAS
jgi:crotonobetainyl-CoA:carnitine CoA-transferase CaiB-like acyl-CoA transferase